MTLLTVGLLKRLSETPGAPGDEGAVRDLIARAIHRQADELRIDRLGNLIAIKRGTGASELRVAVSAHMDEVALFVTEIDKSGLLKVAASGGVNARTVLGKAVLVGPDGLPGVICAPPPHAGGSNSGQTPAIADLVIDIGAADQAAARAKVKLGQRVLFRSAFGFLGPERAIDEDVPLPDQGRVKGKAFDDRLGCLVLIGLLEGERLPFDLYGVFTVREEGGLRGAQVAGFHLEPDAVFILEGTVCDDLPGPPGEKRYPTTRLGDGPALTQRDGSHVAHPPLLQHLMRAAAAHHIPYQFKHPNVGGTDAAGFARWRPMPVGILSTPCRYIHGPVAVADLGDVHNCLRLLRAALPGVGDVAG